MWPTYFLCLTYCLGFFVAFTSSMLIFKKGNIQVRQHSAFEHGVAVAGPIAVAAEDGGDGLPNQYQAVLSWQVLLHHTGMHVVCVLL